MGQAVFSDFGLNIASVTAAAVPQASGRDLH